MFTTSKEKFGFNNKDPKINSPFFTDYNPHGTSPIPTDALVTQANDQLLTQSSDNLIAEGV